MSEFDFSALAIQRGKPVTVPVAELWAVHPDIGERITLPPHIASATLSLAYVGEENREFERDRRRMSAPLTEALRLPSKRPSEMSDMEWAHRFQIEAQLERTARDVDAALFPGRAIVGWERIGKADGSGSIRYSEEAAKSLCEYLCADDPAEDRKWMFDQLRYFCRNKGNFVAAAMPTEQLAGN